jgi:hypothetical protein
VVTRAVIVALEDAGEAGQPVPAEMFFFFFFFCDIFFFFESTFLSARYQTSKKPDSFFLDSADGITNHLHQDSILCKKKTHEKWPDLKFGQIASVSGSPNCGTDTNPTPILSSNLSSIRSSIQEQSISITLDSILYENSRAHTP